MCPRAGTAAQSSGGAVQHSDLHGSVQGCSNPPGADVTREEEEEIGSVLRMLLRKAVQPTSGVAMLENKNPDIFQTFDPVAFSACFFMSRILDSLGFFFSFEDLFEGQRKNKNLIAHKM